MVMGTCCVAEKALFGHKGKPNLLTNFESNILKLCGGLQKVRDKSRLHINAVEHGVQCSVVWAREEQ